MSTAGKPERQENAFEWTSFTPEGDGGWLTCHDRDGKAIRLWLDWPSMASLAYTLVGTLVSVQSHPHRHKIVGERCIRCGLSLDSIREGTEIIGLRGGKR